MGKWLLLICCCLLVETRAQDVFNGCPLTGEAKLKQTQDLNVLKNRSSFPTEVDPTITLEKIVAEGPDVDRFNTNEAATITGYVRGVYSGGSESCNCHSRYQKYRDTHIDVLLDPNMNWQHRMIVEVTPRIRKVQADNNIDWSTKTLRKQLVGHWVKFTGWMLADVEHKGQAFNSKPEGKHIRRQTIWELHPVTAIEVL